MHDSTHAAVGRTGLGGGGVPAFPLHFDRREGLGNCCQRSVTVVGNMHILVVGPGTSSSGRPSTTFATV